MERATHRAPKGRLREGEYWQFCLEHVRVYNQSYNYFAGMSEEAIARYQKEALTGHRPTWRLGLAGKQPGGAWRSHATFGVFTDPFGLFSEAGTRMRREGTDPRESRLIRNAERKALDVLGLEVDATAAEIKARFKMLVKRHHPDANGGDRTTEDRLRQIIQAYNYLKSVRLT
jgi:curved DNA-binding protein CbpA